MKIYPRRRSTVVVEFKLAYTCIVDRCIVSSWKYMELNGSSYIIHIQTFHLMKSIDEDD